MEPQGGGAPARRVSATAPVRVADVGGWTDTWFGGPGRVCSVAVGPGVQVDAELRTAAPDDPAVRIWAADVDEPYGLGPDPVSGWSNPLPGRQPLVEHAVAAVLVKSPLPHGLQLGLHIHAAVPPGAALGTSAAVLVALLGALHALLASGRWVPLDSAALAEEAHRVETTLAGRESGVQDHQAAAHGGVGLLTVDPYPTARWHRVTVPAEARAQLDERLVTVVLGAHDSSAVHGTVIERIASVRHPDHPAAIDAIRRLALLAPGAAAALAAGDLPAWGRTLTAATNTQAELHPGLVGAAHHEAIALAQAHGALGWKVNGAGGTGGSLTVLAADDARPLIDAFAARPGWTVPELRLVDEGVTATVTEP
ncbi:MAG: mevalonate kinase [Acidimicrobiales bacterium]|nr:mevalonate kinase [Acidimicrobiales bacterium]